MRISTSGYDREHCNYEVHPGSWRRDNGRSLSYRELAHQLGDYVTGMKFTHVELLPVMEHPFFGSWGYQTTGYFAPTSRYGSPDEFMYFVDHLHGRGIGVILDWVPSHFPTDAHGLADGLRVDAVASMLYRDYSRNAGEWIPNVHGGRENLEAISFLRRLNEETAEVLPDVAMIAEESTAWPMVTREARDGGLGFRYKWDMGWMHDTLRYLREDPINRRYHHNDLTFRAMYAFSEHYVLPLSHDEVVHGKGSLIGQMAGDEWQRFANLRLLLGLQWGQPGKKLLFMGGEFAQWAEWNHDEELDWALTAVETHQGVMALVTELNDLYQRQSALHELDCDPAGFQWIAADDEASSVVSFLRLDGAGNAVMVVVNATPVPRDNYRIGAPTVGHWAELFNSDAIEYGGSGVGNLGSVETTPVPSHGHFQSIVLTLPPLSVLYLKAVPQ